MPQRIWRIDGIVVWNYGPYPTGQSSIDFADIDDGTVAATRTHPDGRSEGVLIAVATPARRDAVAVRGSDGPAGSRGHDDPRGKRTKRRRHRWRASAPPRPAGPWPRCGAACNPRDPTPRVPRGQIRRRMVNDERLVRGRAAPTRPGGGRDGGDRAADLSATQKNNEAILIAGGGASEKRNRS
jgi:hypothetical protein